MNYFNKTLAALVLATGFTAGGLQAQTPVAQSPAKLAEAPMTVAKANAVVSGNLMLVGTPLGQAVLINAQTGVKTVFQADEDKWVREVFLLDGGKTVGASQADHTVFWNVATGQEIGRLETRVQGFSHDQKLCFALTPVERYLQIYAYPSLKIVGSITSYHEHSVSQSLFSPNDRYLLVQTQNNAQESEITYPRPDYTNVFHVRTRVYLYDLTTMKELPGFSHSFVHDMGTFSADSKFVDMGKDSVMSCSMAEPNAIWRFDIAADDMTKTH